MAWFFLFLVIMLISYVSLFFVADKWPVFVLGVYRTFVCLIFWIGLSVSDKCSTFYFLFF